MVLKEWVEKTGVKPTDPTDKGIVSLTMRLGESPYFSVLFNLEDYRVGRVNGAVVFLEPTRV